uniref:G_PROTEIN_RECEP_F1_2 domain-containing protein n=1 Tax=Angiostrongylus cantonensis TaxID=6313 RepID=A0A158P892_ANGCA
MSFDASNPLIFCNACLGSTDPDYQTYNLTVSGVLLAIVGLIGLIGNILVVRVYTHEDHWLKPLFPFMLILAHLTDFELFAPEGYTLRTHDVDYHRKNFVFNKFALSRDNTIALRTSEFMRKLLPHRISKLFTICVLVVAWAYVFGAPVVFPIAAIFQTSSVYFCVAAAVDCFIRVVLPESVRQLYCTPRKAKMTCTCIMVICILYNIPHFFELEKALLIVFLSCCLIENWNKLQEDMLPSLDAIM